jgi:hypothetical protein
MHRKGDSDDTESFSRALGLTRWSFERWFLIIGVVATVGGQYKTYQNLDEAVEKLKKNEETLSSRYVPREVYELNQQHLTNSINELTQAVKALANEQRGGGARTSTPSRGMFGEWTEPRAR